MGYFNDITDGALIVLVMDADFRSAFYIFAVFRMPYLVVDGDFDTFVAAAVRYHAGYGFNFLVLHFQLPISNHLRQSATYFHALWF